MANPRQRRKARSSTHKPVSHSLHAKRNLKKTPPIRGPKVLQDAWDKHKTVRQNYNTLGLVHRLDPLASGGVEPPETQTAGPASVAPPSRYGKIRRDESGNVIGVELDQEEGMAEAEGGAESVWTEIGKSDIGAKHLLSSSGSSLATAGPRHSSSLELHYLERLLHKHGLDLDSMARDTKLNYEQRTVGQLRRGFKRVGVTVPINV